jgi:feruloyl-CoA synthase
VKATGERVILATGLGSTETAPFSLMCTTDQRIAGNIGVPARAITLKLVPTEEKLEARLKGPNITPGYWRDAALTASAFDDDGFYRLGDAFRFAEQGDAAKGFYFDGRLAENFKLNTGTWVSVGALRARFINHFGEIVRDVVITGLDRDHIAALVFPDVALCRTLTEGLPKDARVEDVLADPRVRAAFAEKLRSLAQASTGSSTRIERLLLMAEPASIDRGEITDKGSINQRAVLRHRADRVEELYEGSPAVIALE